MRLQQQEKILAFRVRNSKKTDYSSLWFREEKWLRLVHIKSWYVFSSIIFDVKFSF